MPKNPPPKPPLRIFLILATSLTRAGLRNCLVGQADLQVVGEDALMESGWPGAREAGADVVVLDGAALADLHDSGQLKDAPDVSNRPALVLFTTGDAMAGMDRAQQAGVRGFIDAETTPEMLVSALRRVAAGERYVSPALAPRLGTERAAPKPTAETPEELLSSRELEVFELTASGLESKEIGDRLGISPRTVDVHRANIRQKLGLSGVHELMRFALTWKQDRERSGRLGAFCNEKRPLLVVEDDEVDILSAQRALARLPVQFRMEAARTGEEALARLRQAGESAPFLILLDINMPRMNGHEFLAELRADPALRTLPVVVLTTSRHDADRERLYSMGIMGYLVKPTTSREYYELFRALAEYWGFNSPPPTSAATTPMPTNARASRAA